MRNKNLWVGLAAAVPFVAVCVLLTLLFQNKYVAVPDRSPLADRAVSAPANVTLQIAGRANSPGYNLDVAATPDARIQGLSGVQSMADDHGMLFWYVAEDNRCFWMKDMRFSLDILWLNADKRVVHEEQNLSPGTYPQAYCADDTQYVVELNAGQAAANSITPGTQLTF